MWEVWVSIRLIFNMYSQRGGGDAKRDCTRVKLEYIIEIMKEDYKYGKKN